MPMKPVEFRIPLPFSVEEFRKALRWATIKHDFTNSGNGEGVVYMEERKMSDEDAAKLGVPDWVDKTALAMFTKKTYVLRGRLPQWMRMVLPKGSIKLREECCNAYPYTIGSLMDPDFLKERFITRIETYYADGSAENPYTLNKRPDIGQEIEIDILDTSVLNDAVDRPLERDNPLQHGLHPEWKKMNPEKQMVIYKVLHISMRWAGMQKKLEKFIFEAYHRIFVLFYRFVYCHKDEWLNITDAALEELEREFRSRIDDTREHGVIPEEGIQNLYGDHSDLTGIPPDDGGGQ